MTYLCADLVAALSGLQVYDFPHDSAAGRIKIMIFNRRCVRRPFVRNLVVRDRLAAADFL